jgi:LacI family transcriptional regulator
VAQGRARRPTVIDVAKHVGVSVSTAGRALGGYGYVSERTRALIEAAADELGYSPNGIARSMRSGSTRSIGFVGSDIANPFFAEAMRGVCDVAREAGYAAILTNSDERLDAERVAVNVLLDKQVEGLIVSPASVTDTIHLARAAQQDVPVVLLDRHLPGLGVDSVVVDNEAAAYDAVTHLLDLGHRRIGLLAAINPSEQPQLVPVPGTRRLTVSGASRPSVDRVRGYLRALGERGATTARSVMRYYSSADPEEGYAQAAALLSLSARPTAVFAADNAATRSVFTVAKRMQLRVPDHVSIVGFDDLEWTSLVEPALTVVAQSPSTMGRAAAERLFARIRGEVIDVREIVVPTELVVRASTARRGRPSGR